MQETTTFIDNSAVVSVDAPPIIDETMYDGYSANIELANFLSRPVLIKSITWTENAGLSTNNFKPWRLFFDTTAIKNKIANFAYLSCNLKLKFVVNASPFYYGIAFAAYRPYNTTVFKPGQLYDGLVNYGPTIAASCRQRIDLLPSKNQGGEMILPYINIRNWIRVNIATDFDAMGEVDVWSYDALLNASSAVGQVVDIQVYAWAENVKLSAATSLLPVQSKEEAYTKGPVSKVASSAASMFRLAEGVTPSYIKPFMKAGSIASEATASICDIFGWSDAPVIDNVQPFKNLPFHGLCSSEISTLYEKLTLDPKNELTIDNRIAGGDGTDELSISYLVGKSCIFPMRSWASSDAVGSTINTIQVTPNVWVAGSTGAVTNNIAVYAPPFALVASSFRFWRGTMVYRFKFICTPYHRGRVIIYWDPQTGTSTDVSTTTNYSIIVDLASEDQVELKVPFMQSVPYLNCATDNTPTRKISNSVNSVGAYSIEDMNGTIFMKVLTRQTSPISSADVFVYCDVSMEDADFANPVNTVPGGSYVSYLQVQSQEEPTTQTVVSSNIANVEVKEHPHLHEIYCGERIKSLRALMRRSSYYRTVYFNSNNTGTVTYIASTQPRRPAYFGYDNNGVTQAGKIVGAAADVPFNFTVDHLMNRWRPCFVGDRGSLNYNFNVKAQSSAYLLDSIHVNRELGTLTYASDYQLDTTTATSLSIRGRNSSAYGKNSGMQGFNLTNQKTQTGIQVTLPMYSRFRFLNTNPLYARQGSSNDESNVDNFTINAVIRPASSIDPIAIAIDEYVAIGLDYQLLFFVNVPTMWFYSSLPPAGADRP